MKIHRAKPTTKIVDVTNVADGTCGAHLDLVKNAARIVLACANGPHSDDVPHRIELFIQGSPLHSGERSVMVEWDAD